MDFLAMLESLSTVRIRQRFELAEMFGFETRNKYELQGPNGNCLLLIASAIFIDLTYFEQKASPVVSVSNGD